MPNDIGSEDRVKRAVQRCLDRFGRLDVLAANAGISSYTPFLEVAGADWQRVLDVNLTGTFGLPETSGIRKGPKR